ncbi:MAG: hypothetical protein ABI379_00900, partial [Rhodanobacter sp.]
GDSFHSGGNMGNSLALLAGMGLIGILVVIIVGIAVGALVLSVAFRLVVGYMPSYLRALGTVVLTWVATIVIALVLGLLLPASVMRLVGAVVLFLAGAWVINYMLRTQTGLAVGFGKACLVQLVYMVIGFVVGIVFGLIMAMVFGSMLLGLH